MTDDYSDYSDYSVCLCVIDMKLMFECIRFTKWPAA